MYKYAVFLAVVLALGACRGEGSPQQDLSITPPAMGVTFAQDFCPSLEVQPGMTVAWTNGDTVTLPIRIEHLDSAGNAIDSGGSDVGPGDVFSTRFTEAGTYRVRCSENRDVYGMITVK